MQFNRDTIIFFAIEIRNRIDHSARFRMQLIGCIWLSQCSIEIAVRFHSFQLNWESKSDRNNRRFYCAGNVFPIVNQTFRFFIVRLKKSWKCFYFSISIDQVLATISSTGNSIDWNGWVEVTRENFIVELVCWMNRNFVLLSTMPRFRNTFQVLRQSNRASVAASRFNHRRFLILL